MSAFAIFLIVTLGYGLFQLTLSFFSRIYEERKRTKIASENKIRSDYSQPPVPKTEVKSPLTEVKSQEVEKKKEPIVGKPRVKTTRKKESNEGVNPNQLSIEQKQVDDLLKYRKRKDPKNQKSDLNVNKEKLKSQSTKTTEKQPLEASKFSKIEEYIPVDDLFEERVRPTQEVKNDLEEKKNQTSNEVVQATSFEIDFFTRMQQISNSLLIKSVNKVVFELISKKSIDQNLLIEVKSSLKRLDLPDYLLKSNPSAPFGIKNKLGNFSYYAINYYYPKNKYEDLPEAESYLRVSTWNFKDGHSIWKDWAKVICSAIFLSNIKREPSTVFAIIPASSKEKTKVRFENFCIDVADTLKITNGYHAIQPIGTREQLKGNTTASRIENLRFEYSLIRGKNIILFDDVITTGKSFLQISNKLREFGANSVTGVFLVETFNSYKNGNPYWIKNVEPDYQSQEDNSNLPF